MTSSLSCRYRPREGRPGSWRGLSRRRRRRGGGRRQGGVRPVPPAGAHGQRTVREQVPSEHRPRPAAHRQEAGGDGPQVRRQGRRPRLHRQGQRPGPHRRLRALSRPLYQGPRPGPRRDWRAARSSSTTWPSAASRSLTKKSPYSIDENLWGRATNAACSKTPGSRRPRMPSSSYRRRGPRRAQTVIVSFEKGIPVSLDGVQWACRTDREDRCRRQRPRLRSD